MFALTTYLRVAKIQIHVMVLRMLTLRKIPCTNTILNYKLQIIFINIEYYIFEEIRIFYISDNYVYVYN